MEAPDASARRNSTSDRLKPAPVYTRPVTFTYEIQNHTTRMQRLTNAFRVYRLMALTLVCVIAGLLLGFLCRPRARNWTERQFMYIEFPGELYLRFLRLLIIPLLVSNVMLSFGSIQARISSRLAKLASALYLSSNVVAITLAIICAVCIRPGGAHKHLDASPAGENPHLGTADKALLMLDAREHSGNLLRYHEYHLPAYSYHSHSAGEPMQGLVASRRHEREHHHRDRSPAERETPAAAAAQAASATGCQPGQPSPIVRAGGTGKQHGGSGAGQQEAPPGGRLGLSTKLPIDVVLDVLRNLVPDSLVGAALQQSRTRLITPKELRVEQDGSTEPAPNRWPIGRELVEQPNIIGLLAMSVLAGCVLSHMGEASKPMLDLCACVSELSLRVGMKAIHLAPFCIMFLLIGQVARARDLHSIAGELLMYSLTVVLALALHGCLILPLAYYCITKKSPLRFLAGLLEALVASFATSSSSSCMALTLNCLTDLELNLVIVRAFGPLGSVFNMNGTSIFESIAAIFIAQTLGVHLPLTSLLLLGLCSAVASLSTAGIPSSGMMTMVIVLNALNLPVLELSLIYIVDFIIDRFRTALNVWSGALICGLIDHLCPEEAMQLEKGGAYELASKYRASRGSLGSRKGSSQISSGPDEKPQVISVTITPPDESSNI